VTIQRTCCASTDFAAEIFDTVLMANLIHVIDDPVSCLRESYRILQREGRLIVVDFTGYRLALSKTIKLAWRYLTE